MRVLKTSRSQCAPGAMRCLWSRYALPAGNQPFRSCGGAPGASQRRWRCPPAPGASAPLGVGRVAERAARRPSDPACTQHSTEELLRTLVLLQGQRWTDQADVERLRDDPVFRPSVSSRRSERPLRDSQSALKPEGLCSQPPLSRCLGWLSTEANRWTLGTAVRETADRRSGLRSCRPAPR